MIALPLLGLINDKVKGITLTQILIRIMEQTKINISGLIGFKFLDYYL